MGSDAVDGYDALLRLVGEVVFEKEGQDKKKGRVGRKGIQTQSKLHSLHRLFHPREL